MFFSGVIQRKLTSLLRQWLAQPPELEVKLGFFRSVIVAKDLKFDTSALNNLIDGGGGAEFSVLFRGVTIDEVIVRVAHWSAPAFTVEFNGVDVTLFLECVFSLSSLPFLFIPFLFVYFRLMNFCFSLINEGNV